MTDLRRYLAIAAALLGVLLIATFAFAAADMTLAEEHRNDKAEKAETEDAETEDDGEKADAEVRIHDGNGEDNHGQCVSKAAHHEADGLEGWRKGLFVSSVALDESMVGEDCDFSSHLSAALSAEARGGGGTETAQTAAPEDDGANGGRESGAAKRAEHQPDDNGEDDDDDEDTEDEDSEDEDGS